MRSDKEHQARDRDRDGVLVNDKPEDNEENAQENEPPIHHVVDPDSGFFCLLKRGRIDAPPEFRYFGIDFLADLLRRQRHENGRRDDLQDADDKEDGTRLLELFAARRLREASKSRRFWAQRFHRFASHGRTNLAAFYSGFTRNQS